MSTLAGLRVLEFAGIGPASFCCMLLADMGAEVIRVERITAVDNEPMEPKFNTMLRGRSSIALDLKHPSATNVALDLLEWADIVIEGYRPGVMERLGLGPDVAITRNPKLVYGRMTGWGQDGPLADSPGHDLNYIALTGALDAIGTKERPVPPLVMVGDFGGGAMYLAVGVLSAYIEAQKSGHGQVVDAAVVDGAASMMTAFFGMLAAETFVERREYNRLDGGSHFYNVYETSDGKFVSIAPTEPKFFAEFMSAMNLDVADFDQDRRQEWPKYREQLQALFKTKTREEWIQILEDKKVCFAPVLSMSEAPFHPHNQFRGTFTQLSGVQQPAPAPRFSRTASRLKESPVPAGTHTREILTKIGLDEDRIDALCQSGAARQA